MQHVRRKMGIWGGQFWPFMESGTNRRPTYNLYSREPFLGREKIISLSMSARGHRYIVALRNLLMRQFLGQFFAYTEVRQEKFVFIRDWEK